MEKRRDVQVMSQIICSRKCDYRKKKMTSWKMWILEHKWRKIVTWTLWTFVFLVSNKINGKSWIECVETTALSHSVVKHVSRTSWLQCATFTSFHTQRHSVQNVLIAQRPGCLGVILLLCILHEMFFRYNLPCDWLMTKYLWVHVLNKEQKHQKQRILGLTAYISWARKTIAISASFYSKHYIVNCQLNWMYWW